MRIASGPLTAAEQEACAGLWLRALAARDGAVPPAGTRERVRALLLRADLVALTALEDDRIVAFATLLPDEPGRADAVHLQHLAVDPASAGRGIGRRLLAAALARADGESLGVSLSVREGNRRAIDLYEAAGFVAAGAPTEHPLGGAPMVRYERPAGGGDRLG